MLLVISIQKLESKTPAALFSVIIWSWLETRYSVNTRAQNLASRPQTTSLHNVTMSCLPGLMEWCESVYLWDVRCLIQVSPDRKMACGHTYVHVCPNSRSKWIRVSDYCVCVCVFSIPLPIWKWCLWANCVVTLADSEARVVMLTGAARGESCERNPVCINMPFQQHRKTGCPLAQLTCENLSLKTLFFFAFRLHLSVFFRETSVFRAHTSCHVKLWSCWVSVPSLSVRPLTCVLLHMSCSTLSSERKL